MELSRHRNPATEETTIVFKINHEEIIRAYVEMHPVHRKILDEYFNEKSSISDILFGISEIAKVLEDLERV